MHIYPTPHYGNIELTDDEWQLVSLVNDYLERIAIIGCLRKHQNADKVLEVLRIQSRLNKPHASYTICDIAVTIGKRSAVQYCEDVARAAKALHEERIAALEKYRK